MNTAIQKLPIYVQEKISHADVPVKYTAAVKALAECRSIDDAKYYADKSDALAAWAKIYKHNEAAIEAKRLKLHAFRRMGEIALELDRIYQEGRGFSNIGGTGKPAARSILLKAGLSKYDAHGVSSVTRLSKEKFTKAVNCDRPKAPSFFINKNYGKTDAWRVLHGQGSSVGHLWAFCSKNDPKEIARGLSKDEAKHAKKIATEIIEWFDTLDQYLPRVDQ